MSSAFQIGKEIIVFTDYLKGGELKQYVEDSKRLTEREMKIVMK